MEPRKQRQGRVVKGWAVVPACACTLISWTAPATEPDAASRPLSEVQITATRRPLAPLDVAPAVTSIGQASLATHTPLTVVDHFRGEPGTFVQETTPGQGVVIIRGLKGSEILHLVDGFRLNNAIFRNAPNQYVALVNPWNLERVEAVRGPMSSLYGGDAMGGVVQFVTRAPEFDSDVAQLRARAGLQGETASASAAGYLEGEVGTARWIAHGGLAWQDVGRLRVGSGERLPFTDFRSRAAHTRVEWRPVIDQTFIAQVQYSRQPNTPRYDAMVAGYGQTSPDSAEAFFRPQERRFAQLRWLSRAPRSFADSVDVQLGFQNIIDDRTTRAFGAPDRELEENSSELVGVSGQLGKQANDRHHVTYGFEAYLDRVRSVRSSIDLATGSETSVRSRFPNGSTMAWIGAYAADEWQVTQRMNTTFGARVTRYRIEVEPNGTDPGVMLEPAAASWNLGFLYRASDALRLVANVGRGFRPPNIFDLGAFGPRQNRFSLPNSNLRPERVFAFEAGFKYESEVLRAELSVFRARHDDKITQVLTGEVDPVGRLIVQSQNATRVDIDGVESGVRRDLTPALSLRAAATWTHGEEQFGSAQHPADRIPPFFGELALRYAPSSRWSAELALRWAATQNRLSPRDQVDPRIEPAGTQGWTALDLHTTFDPTTNVRIAVGVENITDRRYREHGSGFDAPGRNGTVRVDWSF